MTTADTIAWAEAQDAAGKRDAMGQPFTSWLMARYLPDGRAMRDAGGAQVFETQAEFKARQQVAQAACQPGQNMDLFAKAEVEPISTAIDAQRRAVHAS